MTDSGQQADAPRCAVVRSFLLFIVAGTALASDASQIEHVHDALDIEPVDGTCSWFKGLAVADGKLLPVSDMGALMGKPSATGQTLRLNRRIGFAGFRVEQVLGLSTQSPTHVRHRPVFPAPLSAATGDMGVTCQGRVHHLIDFHALFHAPEVLDIADGA